jgi:hypothetical protein
MGQISNSFEKSSVYTIKPIEPKVDFLQSLINQTNNLFIFPKDSLLFVMNKKQLVERDKPTSLSNWTSSKLIMGQALISVPNSNQKYKR